jgi:hypothetical protein
VRNRLAVNQLRLIGSHCILTQHSCDLNRGGSAPHSSNANHHTQATIRLEAQQKVAMHASPSVFTGSKHTAVVQSWPRHPLCLYRPGYLSATSLSTSLSKMPMMRGDSAVKITL